MTEKLVHYRHYQLYTYNILYIIHTYVHISYNVSCKVACLSAAVAGVAPQGEWLASASLNNNNDDIRAAECLLALSGHAHHFLHVNENHKSRGSRRKRKVGGDG